MSDLNNLVDTMQNDWCWADRRNAARNIGRMGSDAIRAIPALSKRLREESDEDVRFAIVGALEAIADPSVISFLEKCAQNDRSQYVRQSASQAVASLLTLNVSTTEMVAAMSKSKDDLRIASYLHALSKRLLDQEAIQAVFNALNNKSSKTRVSATIALKTNQPGGWAGAIAEQFNREKDNTVRSELAIAMTESHVGCYVIAGYCHLLQVRDWQTRQNAAVCLGESGEKTALPYLLQRLPKESDEDVFAAIAIAVGKIGDQSAIQTLQRWVNDRNRTKRVAINQAIETLQRVATTA